MFSPISFELGLVDAYPNPYKSKSPYTFPFLGGRGDDYIVGDDEDNVLKGFAGNDIFLGRGGDDVIYGGKGSDYVGFRLANTFFEQRTKGVFVSLSQGLAIDSKGGTDRLFSIEHVEGSQFDDELIGNRKSNDISGGPGNDKLLGMDGDDLLHGSYGADFLIGGKGRDTFLYTDVLDGGDRIHGFKSGVDQFLMRGPVNWFAGQIGDNRNIIDYTGTLKAENFFLGSSASNDNQVFGYNAATKQVLYDANGSQKGGVSVIATLTGSTSIVASDIDIYQVIV